MTRFRALTVVFVGLFSGFNSSSFAADPVADSQPVAEVVWTETFHSGDLVASETNTGNDRKIHHLLYRSYDDGIWSSEATSIYASEFALTTPALVSKQSGEKLLFWTEQIGDKAVLKYMRGRLEDNFTNLIVWDEARLFSQLGRYNIAPSALVDGSDRVWLFWAADVDAYSDIYYARETPQGWSQPQRVNKKNSVPDSTPVVRLNKDGQVGVDWITYDLQLGGYTVASKEFLLENQGVNLPFGSIQPEEELVAKMSRPDFLPKGQRIQIHFPQHHYIQSLEQ